MNKSLLEKATGSFLGLAIGDALGWPNEFKSRIALSVRNVIDFREWEKKVTYPTPYYDKIKKGEYSDDTQLTLAVARSLLTNEWEYHFTLRELPFWLNYQRGGGRALLQSARTLANKKIVPWKIPINDKYWEAGGNGTVMRILPHVIAKGDKSLEELLIEVTQDAIITHGHPRAILGTRCYAVALDYIMNLDKEFNPFQFVLYLLSTQTKWGVLEKEHYKEWYDTAIKYPGYNYQNEWRQVLDNMLAELDYISKEIVESPILNEEAQIQRMGCLGEAKGAGDIAIISSIYFTTKYFNDPVQGIRIPAQTPGMDTDTIASITGTMLGMINGIDWIPENWKEVQDYNLFPLIADLLLTKDLTKIPKNDDENIKWKSTPIGNIRMIEKSDISTSMEFIGELTKWETMLGQTIYTKGI